MVLEREKLIQSQNRGSRKLYFPAGVPMPEDGGGLHEIPLRMLRVLDERPGITLRDLAGVLGVSTQLLRYHLRTLQMQRLAVVQRVGLTSQVFRVAGRGRRAPRTRSVDPRGGGSRPPQAPSGPAREGAR